MGNGRAADVGVRLNKKLVISGAVLVGIGGSLAAAGVLLGSTAIASAMRQWVRQLDQPPSEMARQKWSGGASSGWPVWRIIPPESYSVMNRRWQSLKPTDWICCGQPGSILSSYSWSIAAVGKLARLCHRMAKLTSR